MFAAHQVTDLALDLRAGGGVVGLPFRVGLPGAGAGERLLVRADMDRSPAGGGGAPVSERTGVARQGEPGDLPVLDRSQRRGLSGGSAHGPGVEIDLELVLGEPAVGRDGRLDLAHDLRVGVLER